MSIPQVKISVASNNPPGKLADAELHFTDGVLAGLKLTGFAIWERRSGGGRNVTFPSRTYSVNGEPRSFALLRGISDANAGGDARNPDSAGIRQPGGGGAVMTATSVHTPGPWVIGSPTDVQHDYPERYVSGSVDIRSQESGVDLFQELEGRR